MKNNEFLKLIDYTEGFHLNQEEAIDFLHKTLNQEQDFLYSYDYTDYPKLIFIEKFFQNNQEIQNLIERIKTNIYNSYPKKKKYIKKFTIDQQYKEYKLTF